MEKGLEGSIVRRFKFLELFAGQAGFSGAVELAGGELVEVMNHQDSWTTSWDILVDEDFERARAWVREADHTHLAPPCKSFTKARRSDKFGATKVVRSQAQPEGWGDPLTVEGNKIVERAAVLLDEAQVARNTASLENPEDSFIWEQPTLERHMKRMRKVGVDQCPYGAETKKPTGILTDAAWMADVCARCVDARARTYARRAGWKDPGLFLRSSQGSVENCFGSRVPHWTLLGMGAVTCPLLEDGGRTGDVAKESHQSGRERTQSGAARGTVKAASKQSRKERDGKQPGSRGLRNPYGAIQSKAAAWKLGASVHHVLLGVIKANTRELQALTSGAPFAGFREDTVEAATSALSSLAGVKLEAPSPIRVTLLESLLNMSHDPEKDVANWLREAFPLGIEKELGVNNVFPMTEGDTKAVELSRQFPLLTDWCDVDQAENYKSFQEAGRAALEELERVAEAGYATRCNSWAEVLRSAGEGASLTRLGCIQKPKPGGGVKTRLVVDCRRSGINGLMCIRQRVVLPRVSDVANDWATMMQEENNAVVHLAVIDFRDAFYQCRLAPMERKHVVVKASGSVYYILEVVAFGLACGPLLWSRLAAALVRLSQAACWDTARIQCYVDDPLLVVKGPNALARSVNLAIPLLLW